MAPRGGAPDPADAGAQGVRHDVGMRTRHLSVTVTAYEDGTYALAYLVRSYQRGRPRGREVVARKAADRESVIRLAAAAIEAMVTEEDLRRATEMRLQELEDGMEGGFVSG